MAGTDGYDKPEYGADAVVLSANKLSTMIDVGHGMLMSTSLTSDVVRTVLAYVNVSDYESGNEEADTDEDESGQSKADNGDDGKPGDEAGAIMIRAKTLPVIISIGHGVLTSTPLTSAVVSTLLGYVNVSDYKYPEEDSAESKMRDLINR